jgi:CubicO group peptidase (beta-lactamase class C family)
LGCLIEVISGMSLEDFLRTTIFTPLGMNDTYFNVPASKSSRMASVYTEDSVGHIIPWSHTFRNIDPDYPLMNKHYFSGGAGLSSTIYDYAIFLQMLLNGGIYNGHRILSPRTVELMTSPQLDFNYSGSDNFGLGFGLTSAKSANRNLKNEGTYGWGGYYGTNYWVDPKAHLVVLIYTQHTPNSHWDFGQKFEQAVYSSIIK